MRVSVNFQMQIIFIFIESVGEVKCMLRHLIVKFAQI